MPFDCALCLWSSRDAVTPQPRAIRRWRRRWSAVVSISLMSTSPVSIPLVSTPVWTSSSAAPTVKVTKSTPLTLVLPSIAPGRLPLTALVLSPSTVSLFEASSRFEDLEHVQRERIAVAAEVDGLDALDAGVRNGAEIEDHAGAIETQGVAAGAAEDAPAAGAEAIEERRIEQDEVVIALAAVQNVDAALAEQDIVALGAEDHVVAGRARELVVAGGRRAGSPRR